MGAGRVAVNAGLKDRFFATRKLTADLAAPLSDADATVQSMPDASPTKWHLAHVTWFLETFILRDHVAGYRAFDDNFAYLFNSYYEAEGARHARTARGLLTRPSLSTIGEYRTHVETAIDTHWNNLPDTALQLIELGIHHEQQHQELLLTDILHLLSQNPVLPAYWPGAVVCDPIVSEIKPLGWIDGPSGIQPIGQNNDGCSNSAETGFAFDCEGPRHEVLLQPFALADRTVTNGEWLQFMNDGGYRDARHWLSDGWAWVQAENIVAPLYWRRAADNEWTSFGLDGLRPIDPDAPVTHISLYEADAYASWAHARLPTEMEWEAVASACNPDAGNQLDAPGAMRPMALHAQSLFGNVWQRLSAISGLSRCRRRGWRV
jgi:ergothioneine biosynthesis protein EgtB